MSSDELLRNLQLFQCHPSGAFAWETVPATNELFPSG